MMHSSGRAFAIMTVVLVAVNIAATAYAYRQADQRFSSQARRLTTQAAVTRRTAARTEAQLRNQLAVDTRELAARLDRNWRMVIVARKAACAAFTAATPLPHASYPSECNLANMQPPGYYTRFWTRPTGWNRPN